MKNLILTTTAVLLIAALQLKAGATFKPKYDSTTCLVIEGKILNADEGIEGQCKVELLDANGVVDTAILKEGKRKFKFVLKKNTFYAIRVTKEGYISRLVSINTEMLTKEDDMIHKFSFETKLMPEERMAHLNTDALDFPIAIIHYDYDLECFSYNREYTNNLKKELRLANKRTPQPLASTQNEISHKQ